MYRPVLDAVAGSLFITALVAMLPLLALFVLLGVVRMRAWLASVIALAVAILVAVIAYSMPVTQAVLAATEGAAFGFFPILWIVINAIWIYNMTVVTGHFDVLRRSFTRVSDDARIQAVIVAFCFGALLEALAGFGTPVAITTVMLMALGFRPFKAAAVSLVANTAPVAFGALATPITTLAAVSGLPEHALSQMVGRQTPILGLFVPMALVFIIDRGKGVRETLPATLTCGVAFAITQFVTSNYISTQLTDIVASLVSALAVVLLLRVWQPANRYVELDTEVTAGAGTGGAGSGGCVNRRSRGDSRRRPSRPSGRRGFRSPDRRGSGHAGGSRRSRRRRPRHAVGHHQGVRALPDRGRRLRPRPAPRHQGPARLQVGQPVVQLAGPEPPVP
jgi:lactate permease